MRHRGHHVAQKHARKANFADGRDCLQVGTRFFSRGTWRIVQERERLLGFLKASRIQRFISFCSVRIHASPSRISLSSFSTFPAFIFPAWRSNEVEFGRFIVFEGKSCDRTYLNRRVTNEWFPYRVGFQRRRRRSCSRLPRAWASKANFANGRAFYGLANDGLVSSSAVGQPECKTKADGMFTASSVVSVREADA
jgi:hypothetical protein